MMAANLLTSIFLLPCAVVALMVAQVFLAAFITRRGVFFDGAAQHCLDPLPRASRKAER